ncbi:MAG TPA: hypothetical protein VMT30_00555 [Candidatus Saccharimonadia bacterium]|nr:hypothetical protein [Candidatus Saccharimonadia bacterium]
MRYSTVDDAVRKVHEERQFPTEFRPERDILGYIWIVMALLIAVATWAGWRWVVPAIFSELDRNPDKQSTDKPIMAIAVILVTASLVLWCAVNVYRFAGREKIQAERFRATVIAMKFPLESHLGTVRELLGSTDLEGYDLHLASGHPTVIFAQARITWVDGIVHLKPVGRMDLYVDLWSQRAGLGAMLDAVAANAADR